MFYGSKEIEEVMTCPNSFPQYADEARQIIKDNLGTFDPRNFEHRGHELLIRNLLRIQEQQPENPYSHPKAIQSQILKILGLDHQPLMRGTQTLQ